MPVMPDKLGTPCGDVLLGHVPTSLQEDIPTGSSW